MYKILVVEDEEIIRKGIIYSIDYSKYNCEIVGQATDGKDGIQKIQMLKPDIVLTDITMPYISGLEMIKRTINEYKYACIILSGYNEFEYAQKAIEFDVVSYLLKPIDNKLLIEAIEKAKNKINLKYKQDKLEKDVDFVQRMLTFMPIELNENPTQYSITTNQIIRYIKENYNKKIDNDILMEVTQKGKTYINTVFKKDTNTTINTFINDYRIIQAVELLQQNIYTISEVSEKVGIKNYRYFIEVFKKYTNFTPKEFSEKCFKNRI